MGWRLINKHAWWLIILTLGVSVYFGSLPNKFVLDDPAQTLDNPLIGSVRNIPKLFLGSSFGGGSNLEGVYYKPLMTACFTLINHFFGLNPTYFHLFQILIHIINTILLSILFKVFFRPNLALILALLFLVHPINSEAVIYISALQEVLFFCFGILAFLTVTKPALCLKDYLLFASLIFLSLFSKETGILFLVISLIYIWMLKAKQDFGKLFLLALVIIVLYLLLRHLTVGILSIKDPIFPIMRASFWERLLTMPKIIFYYLSIFFYPKDLSIDQHWVVRSVASKDFYLPVIFDLAFFSIIIVFAKKFLAKDYYRKFWFFVYWLTIGLLLHFQLIPLDATVANRWFYFAGVGMLGILGVTWQHLAASKKKYLKYVLFILVVILSFRTIIRISDWRDGLTLAYHDIKINQDNFALENNLGFELFQAQQYEEAQLHTQKSVMLAPYWWLNWNNLGVLYRHKFVQTNNTADLKKSEDAFVKAIANTNVFYLPYENLAETLFYFEDPTLTEQSIEQISQKIKLNSQLWFWLALSQYRLKEYSKAQVSIHQAYLLDSTNTKYQDVERAISNRQSIEVRRPNY